jgi:hypothetical protein
MTKPPKRREVVDQLEEISPYNLDGKTPDEVINYFKQLKARHGPDCYIEWDAWFSYPYESGNSPRYFLKRKRPENDTEYEARMAAEKIAKEEKKQRELAELERLQKLYGKAK